MSRFDDYGDEMAPNGFSDRDVDQLLSELATVNEELAGLAPFLQALRDQNIRGVPDDQVVAFAQKAAEIARSVGAPLPDQTASLPARRSRLLRPRLATALALVLLLGGMSGVAIAADDAVPGDPLYGLDRALEMIGIGNGAAAERIAEAQALLEGGLLAEAVSHAAGAVDSDAGILSDDGSQAAADALRAAAEAVTSTDEGEADEVRAKVAEMLNWMATNATSEDPMFGNEFGEMVAGFAREISSREGGEEPSPPELPENSGPPEGVPGGPPDGVPPGPPVSVPVRP